MIPRVKSTVVAVATAATLVLSACGGGAPGGSGGGPGGDPEAGGVARVIEGGAPTTLDPALLQNSWARMGTVGNALYGTLLVDNKETTEFDLNLLERFDTADGGTTFTLKVKKGLVFSDGSHFTAEAVKFGWDRMRDPATGSSFIGQASMIKAIDLIDELTAKVTLVVPSPNFASVITTTSLNWIGKPSALKKGRESFEKDPIGAGPFVLEEWQRGSVVSLKKNPKYWDAPRPYLDRLEIRSVQDVAQRFNILQSGQADLVVETGYQNTTKAKEIGLATMDLPIDGGQMFALNAGKPPFDDVRARRAASFAIDLDAFNLAAHGGHGIVPETLFREESPFYSDVPMHTYDPDKAQALLDELADEGKPLEFSFSYFPASNSVMFEALQAQLSRYDNLTFVGDQRDPSELGKIAQQGDFQMTAHAIVFGAEPDPQVSTFLHSRSTIGNIAHVSDPELDAALDAANSSADMTERVSAYKTVQEKIAELVPYVFHTRSGSGVMYQHDTHGIEWYGLGVILPENLWVES